MEDPRISLVVEWENTRYREIERGQRMLRSVVAQVGELSEPVEVRVRPARRRRNAGELITAAAYYTLGYVAELLTRANPRFVERLYEL